MADPFVSMVLGNAACGGDAGIEPRPTIGECRRLGGIELGAAVRASPRCRTSCV